LLAEAPADRFQTPAEAALALAEYVTQSSPAIETHLDFYAPAAPGSTVNILPAVRELKRRQGSDGLRLVLLVSLGGLLLLAGGLAARRLLPGHSPASRPGNQAAVTQSVPTSWLDPRHLPPDDRKLGGSFPNPAAVLRPPSGAVRTLSFHPAATVLASAGDDGQIHFWDWKTGQPLPTIAAHSRPVLALAFSPDGRSLLSAGRDKKVRLWDVASRKEKSSQATPSEWVTFACFAPDGQTACVRANTKEIRIWDIGNRAALSNRKFGDKTIGCFAYRPDGKAAAVGVERSVQLWDAALANRLGGKDAHAGTVSAVAFSPDGKLLASGSHDRTIKLWDAETGVERATLAGHTNHLVSLAFTPDSQALASADAKGQVILWNPAARVPLAEGQLPADISEIAISPDGHHLVTAGVNGVICIFRIGAK